MESPVNYFSEKTLTWLQSSLMATATDVANKMNLHLQFGFTMGVLFNLNVKVCYLMSHLIKSICRYGIDKTWLDSTPSSQKLVLFHKLSAMTQNIQSKLKFFRVLWPEMAFQALTSEWSASPSRLRQTFPCKFYIKSLWQRPKDSLS